jgi:selenocysteine-specific elongation factor
MPKRRFILGTAGHVDHGKTELVRRITGWDTDRLKEEKERGISIELGFAPLPIDDDTVLGIVDVPGHERFVKHMVAGAGGVDMALLVVASDEGVMPQTREHLEVLRSLAISHGIVVMTKSDLATEDLAAMVSDDIGELVVGTFLEGAPIVQTSAKTGDGVDALLQELRALCDRIPPRDTDGPFRLAVDRVFHQQGIGVVVTGSCYSGTVQIGDKLELLPSEKNVRVREIQSFGEKREQGFAGERLAIALQGGKLGEVSRGDMLVTPRCFGVGYMIDARVRVARYTAFEVKQRQRVRLHHGAKEVLGRIVLLESDTLISGDDLLVQLRLETPIVAGEGDYFVLRTYSPARVLGGGRIIDESASKHRTGDERVLGDLAIREAGDPLERTRKELRDAGIEGVKAKALDATIMKTLIDDETAVAIGSFVFSADAANRLGDDIERLAVEFTDQHPLRFGLDKEELRQKVGFVHPTPLFNRLLEELSGKRPIYLRGNAVRAGSAAVQLPEDLAKEIDILEGSIRAAGVLFLRDADLKVAWRGREALADVLQFLLDSGRVHRIGNDGFLHDEGLQYCLERVRSWIDERGEITVAEFKELFDVTRKHAIPLLEFLDAERYTTRRENTRVAGPKMSGRAS